MILEMKKEYPEEIKLGIEAIENQKPEKAIKYFEKAIEKGYSEGYTGLGLVYFGFKELDPTFKKSFQYFKQGAEKGNKDSECMLGVLYFQGKGVEEDKEKAFYYFNKAAESNDPFIMYMVGNAYEVENNIDEAIKWYTKAAEKGYVLAEEILKYLRKRKKQN
jgi:TPR repeat protein